MPVSFGTNKLHKRMSLLFTALFILSLFGSQQISTPTASATAPNPPVVESVTWLEQVPVSNPGGALVDQILRGHSAQGGRQPLPTEAQRIFMDASLSGSDTPGVQYKTG